MSRMYQESVYEGYLHKSPPNMNRKWQKRYFVLLPYQKLLYFSKYNGEQKGIIDLDRVQEVILDVYISSHPITISVEVKGLPEDPGRDRTYYLQADTREEMETWHRNICEVAGLQLCRKNNVVADYTQGDENYMSARRKTALDREETDKRALLHSFNPDTGQSSDYGTYTRDTEFSQSAGAGQSYGLYATQGPGKGPADLSGEDSGSEDDGFTSPDQLPPLRSSKTPPPSKRVVGFPKQQSSLSVCSLPIEPSPPLSELSPPLPPHREEQMYPERPQLNPPMPPRRVSSQKRLCSPRYPAPSSDDRPRPKERKSVTTRETRNVAQFTQTKDQPAPRKRAAAKTPSIPISVLLTTVQDITPDPVAKPRRPASSVSEEGSDTPLSPVSITPYKTVMRGSEIFSEQEPIYANDPEDGAYVRYDPGDSREMDGHYVTVSRNPLDVSKLAQRTDVTGYTKIIEPKPRNKMSASTEDRIS